MRIDRLLTLGVAGPLRALSGGPSRNMAILMYHSISGARKDEGYYGLTTSTGLFREQMDYLHRTGYAVVSLAEGVRSMLSAAPNPWKSVVLTFDDGFLDFYTQAYPVLRTYGFPATVFLPVLYIEDPRMHIRDMKHMRWEHVRELAAAGVHFGSHTYVHTKLTGLRWPEIDRELRYSKQIIEEKIGKPVDAFSYPFALPGADRSFTTTFQSRLRTHGYRCGVTTRIGTSNISDNPFLLKRLPINSGDDLPLFVEKLRGSYDWVRHIQSFVKCVKQLPLGAHIREVGLSGC